MYHFIGIKGAGMSSLAIILKRLGNDVQGSDVDKHFFTEKGLIENNIKMLTYNKDNITDNMIIIKGASITPDNEELIAAKKLNLPIYEYNEMVGILTEKYKTICIAGCHGKTTTTSMTAHVLGNIKGANYLIGDGQGYADKKNEFFALESCEYRRHFLAYTPYYAVITNIDLDHVDYYKDIDDIIDAYTEYANKATKMVIMCGDDKYINKFKPSKETIYYGLNENNNIRAINIEYKSNGISFDVLTNNKSYGHFDLPIYGIHQLYDALAVITICYLENIASELVNKEFQTFKGARRRFTETIVKDNIIIDDYAHHPKEVQATINSIKQKYPDKKIITIFQPHTFTRTKEFASDFVDIFKTVDEAYIMDIHPAREKQEDYPNITSDIIISKLPNGHKLTINDANVLSKYNNAVFAFMSPNDVSKLENDLKELLTK